MNVILPAGEPVDLYDESGITPGTQIAVQNIAGNDVRVSLTEAGVGTDYNVLGPYASITSASAPAGQWAMCVAGGAVNVQEVV